MIKNTELKQILFPTDFSETSLRAGEFASLIAGAFKADITLLHIIETSVYKSVFPELDPETFAESEISKAVENRMSQYAEELAGGRNIKVDPLFQSGTVSDLVFEAIGTTRADLVITGLHGVKGIQKYFAGSNAYKIATRSAVPVLSVPASARTSVSTILLPVVEEISTLEKAPWAGLFGSKMNAKVKVLGLIRKGDDEQIEAVQGNVHTIMTYLAKNDVVCEVLYEEKDDYAGSVLEYSDKTAADLVCIMTDRKKDTTGIFPGSAANRILNESKVAVLTMHPDSV